MNAWIVYIDLDQVYQKRLVRIILIPTEITSAITAPPRIKPYGKGSTKRGTQATASPIIISDMPITSFSLTMFCI